MEGKAIGSSAFALLVLVMTILASVYWTAVVADQEVTKGQKLSLVDDNQITSRDQTYSVTRNADDTVPKAREVIRIREFKARMTLTLALILGTTASILVYFYCLVNVWQQRYLRWTLIALILLPIIWSMVNTNSAGSFFPGYGGLLDAVSKFRIAASSYSAVAMLNGFQLPDFGNAFLVIATVAFTLSAWYQIAQLRLIVPNSLDDSCDLQESRTTINGTNREIVRLLYIASALLVGSVIGLHSYYSWPAALLTDSLAEEVVSLATVIAIMYGTVFTAWIIAVLGPAMWAVNEKIQDVARIAVLERAEDKTPLATDDGNTEGVLKPSESNKTLESRIESWRRENGFVTTAMDRAFRILATIAPILIGPIMEILKSAVA